MKKVIFYFDGFNFYNGLKTMIKADPDWRRFYWIDFVVFCKQFLGDDQSLEKVKYFSAPPLNPGKRSRQQTLFSANTLLNPDCFEVINGKYYNKSINCKLCHSSFEVPEEKRTDVNISLEMMLDCFHDKVDKLVLVSADSDLITTVQSIKKHFPQKQIKVYFPPKRSSADLLNECKPVIYLEKNKKRFDGACMPRTVTNGAKSFTIPVEWS